MSKVEGALKGEEEQALLIHIDGAAAILMLNRPQARNCLSIDLITRLHTAITQFSNDPAITALIITGAPPAFCSGHDLQELTRRRKDVDSGQAFYTQAMRCCSEMMLAITNCPKPVIAAVNGVASAAGCQLVASCDLAVASNEAKFITPGMDIGLFCSTPMVPLSRAISRKAALEMLLLAEPVSAEKAKDWGLINEVVSSEHVLPTAQVWVEKIARKSSSALSFGKRAFYRQLQMPLEEAYLYTSEIMVQNMLDDDAIEGISAFVGKRKPEWPLP